MSSTIRSGRSVGVDAGLRAFVMGFTGRYLRPALLELPSLAISIQTGLLVVG